MGEKAFGFLDLIRCPTDIPRLDIQDSLSPYHGFQVFGTEFQSKVLIITFFKLKKLYGWVIVTVT